MPKSQSAKKSFFASERKRKYNLQFEKELKEMIKKFKKTRKKADFEKIVALADKAASKKIIHQNKAARIKSRLSQLITQEKKKQKQAKRKIKKEK